MSLGKDCKVAFKVGLCREDTSTPLCEWADCGTAARAPPFV
jgi:hypothetical protein